MHLSRDSTRASSGVQAVDYNEAEAEAAEVVEAEEATAAADEAGGVREFHNCSGSRLHLCIAHLSFPAALNFPTGSWN